MSETGESGGADLHLHTVASDGTCTIDDRIEQARERELDAIAITDHDTTAEELRERVATVEDTLELITGVEVRADCLGMKVELLGYYVDPDDEGLRSLLERVRSYRRERNRAMIEKLRETTELERPYDEIRSNADGILGRPHVAEILIDEGIVDSIGAAFDQHIAPGGDAFVPMERVPATNVVETLQDAGGVVSLAHPGRTRTDDLDAILAGLVDDGLDAIEVPYPYNETRPDACAAVTSADAGTLADEYDLLHTGGSDCHGPGSGKFRIGSVRLSSDRLADLRKLAERRRPL